MTGDVGEKPAQIVIEYIWKLILWKTSEEKKLNNNAIKDKKDPNFSYEKLPLYEEIVLSLRSIFKIDVLTQCDRHKRKNLEIYYEVDINPRNILVQYNKLLDLKEEYKARNGGKFLPIVAALNEETGFTIV